MTHTVLRGTALALASAALAVLPAVPARADALRAQQWALQAVHAQQAWRTTKGEGVTVAVLDTGVDANHPDLEGQVEPERDLVGFGPTPGTPPGPGTAPEWPASSQVTAMARTVRTGCWESHRPQRSCRSG